MPVDGSAVDTLCVRVHKSFLPSFLPRLVPVERAPIWSRPQPAVTWKVGKHGPPARSRASGGPACNTRDLVTVLRADTALPTQRIRW